MKISLELSQAELSALMRAVESRITEFRNYRNSVERDEIKTLLEMQAAMTGREVAKYGFDWVFTRATTEILSDGTAITTYDKDEVKRGKEINEQVSK